ncbi:MAG: hypothetical protein JSV57_01065 [Candidatus Bathyarchaeota archaeon]|nr:MAG: hypothetical protein JSV57_01065 [Candidatus Bathyarchaeota archaeon]
MKVEIQSNDPLCMFDRKYGMAEYFRKRLFPEQKEFQGKCVDCHGSLELYEIDFKNKSKVLLCKRCGLLHLYAKSFLGGWKLAKARKMSEF